MASSWRESGVEEGDIILIHSSLKRLLIENPGLTPDDVLNSLIKAVGPDGTLLFPLFNFDFCKGVAFDIRTTPSHMGALTEAARNYPGAIRTGHPVYSFAVIGSRAAEFNVTNKSAYGSDSPFAILHKLGGKIGVIDLPDQNSMTFYHYVEEQHQVPYRYYKDFTADYTNAGGKTEKRSFQIYVRDIENKVETDVGEMENILWAEGLYKGAKPGLRVIKAEELYNRVARVITSGEAENTLYRIGK